MLGRLRRHVLGPVHRWLRSASASSPKEDPGTPPDADPALVAAMNRIKWWHRIPLGNGLITPGVCFHGKDGEDYASRRFGLPVSLAGKTVLDIGAWDGYFSFEAERRGAARVVAADISLNPPGTRADDFGSAGNWGGHEGFRFAHEVLKSRVEYVNASIFDIDEVLAREPARYPSAFDYVLFFGVLYHLREPLRALERLFRVTGELALIETAVSPARSCSMEFRPGYDDDPTNFWYPTHKCLVAMLKFVGYRRVSRVHHRGPRLTVRAER